MIHLRVAIHQPKFNRQTVRRWVEIGMNRGEHLPEMAEAFRVR
jgi:tRNA G46 methylase TrmB